MTLAPSQILLVPFHIAVRPAGVAERKVVSAIATESRSHVQRTSASAAFHSQIFLYKMDNRYVPLRISFDTSTIGQLIQTNQNKINNKRHYFVYSKRNSIFSKTSIAIKCPLPYDSHAVIAAATRRDHARPDTFDRLPNSPLP
jgi:hypothetical protein